MYFFLLPLVLLPLVLTFLYLLRQNYSSSAEPPVVKSWIPFLGSALEFGKDSTRFMAKNRAQLGDIFTVIMGGKRMTFILDNTAWDTVFFKPKPTLSFEPFKKDAMIGAFGARPEVANIPEIEKQAHNHYIKYLQTSGLDKMSSTINQHLLTWFQRDRAKHGVGKPIQSNLYELVLRCGFDAGMSTMFGDSFGEGYPQLLEKFKTFDSKFAMLLGGAPNIMVKDAAKARADLIEYMAKENFDGTHSDMMKARQEMFAQTNLTKMDVGGYNLAILWASQSNTLPALFWFVYYVWRDPVALAAVRKEVDEVLEKYGAKESLLITRDALKEMIVLDSCMNEVLRLRTGSITVRAALEDTTLELPNGRTLYARKGDSLALFPYLHHHDPHVFKDPENFIWDRFMPTDGKAPVFTNPDGSKCKHTVVAFGGGISMCPGRFFVMNEAKVLAVLMLQLLDFEMDPNHTPPAMEITRCGLGIIPPANDVQISYKYRD